MLVLSCITSRNAARARAKNVTLRTQKKFFGKQRLDNLAHSLSVAGKLTAPSKSTTLPISTLQTPDISVNSSLPITVLGRSSAVAGIELGHAKRKQDEAFLDEPLPVVHCFMPAPQAAPSSRTPEPRSGDSPSCRSKRIRSSKIISVLDESERRRLIYCQETQIDPYCTTSAFLTSRIRQDQ